jgi:hypothetical protein
VRNFVVDEQKNSSNVCATLHGMYQGRRVLVV